MPDAAFLTSRDAVSYQELAPGLIGVGASVILPLVSPLSMRSVCLAPAPTGTSDLRVLM